MELISYTIYSIVVYEISVCGEKGDTLEKNKLAIGT